MPPMPPMPDPRERWVELCEELEAGEIGGVEFFEEALDLGIDLPLIAAELQKAKSNDACLSG